MRCITDEREKGNYHLLCAPCVDELSQGEKGAGVVVLSAFGVLDKCDRCLKLTDVAIIHLYHEKGGE